MSFEKFQIGGDNTIYDIMDLQSKPMPTALIDLYTLLCLKSSKKNVEEFNSFLLFKETRNLFFTPFYDETKADDMENNLNQTMGDKKCWKRIRMLCECINSTTYILLDINCI